MMKLYNVEHSTGFNPEAHAGLWFERFCPETEIEKYKRTNNEIHKPKWLEALESNKIVGANKSIDSFCDRQRAMVLALNGKSLAFTADWHFVSGMGNPHSLENGFSWHHTLGVPYLSGAAIKGLLRSTLELAFDGCSSEKKSLLFNWFGGNDPAGETEKSAAGQLIFFDAIPFEPPTIGLDVMTPHTAKWNLEGGIRPNQADTVPADWHDPVPIQYLVAKQMTLIISFAPRKSATIDIEEVGAVIEHALSYVGAGAKTNVGYGFFTRDTNTDEAWEKELVEKIEESTLTATMSEVEKKIHHYVGQYGLAEAVNALEDDRLFTDDEKEEAATVIKERLLLEKKWDVKPHRRFVKNKPYARVQIVKKYLP